MQYEERKTKPESTRKLLIQQVEEQSALCDVTVKMGHWEKKFHHCVLVACPFFEHVLEDNFLEKQTGKVEVTVGTPITIEMAILFLYGKKPKLKYDNIEHMMALAEFLLIPNLKSACISWLKTVTITEENCMNLLQLSSIYDFEMPKCEEYIMGRMSEMLHHAQMVNLSKESVQHLFADKKLSYVRMDDKLSFLIRWSNSQLARRKNFLREMFQLIDFHEVSKVMLDELKANQNVSAEIDLENIFPNEDNDIPNSHRVLIMKGENSDGTFWCLDLEREAWFQLKLESMEEGRNYHYWYSDISGARKDSNCSEIYFVQNNHQNSNVLILNLEEDICKTYKLVLEDNGGDLRNIDDVCIFGDICIAYINERVKTNKQTVEDTGPLDVQSRLRLMSLLRCNPMEQILALKVMEDERAMRSRYTDTATLYIGHIHVEDENIKMSPLLTFKDDKISKLCINKMITVAIILGSRKTVSLFDLVDYKLETIQLKTEYNDKLIHSDEGFVICGQERCICITRINGPSLSSKFLTKKIALEIHSNYQNKYFFCENTWYHYHCEKYKEHFRFESASHGAILSKCSFEDVAWKRLPLPKENERCYSSTIKENAFQICLPKCKLRCDIECPHCKLKPEVRTRRTYSIACDSDSSYYDSSDDDCYGHAYYDDEYGYYYD